MHFDNYTNNVSSYSLKAVRRHYLIIIYYYQVYQLGTGGFAQKAEPVRGDNNSLNIN